MNLSKWITLEHAKDWYLLSLELNEIEYFSLFGEDWNKHVGKPKATLTGFINFIRSLDEGNWVILSKNKQVINGR